MRKSLRYKLSLSFIFVSLFTIVLFSLLSFHYSRKKSQIDKLTEEVNALYIEILHDFSNINNFIGHETANSSFFISGESTYLTAHQNSRKSTDEIFEQLNSLNQRTQTDISGELSSIKNQVNQYSFIFKKIVELIYKRGYTTYGLEGELKNLMFKMENTREFKKDAIYAIRKDEKDYFITHESSCAESVQQNSSKLVKTVSCPGQRKDSLIALVNHYVYVFNQIVTLDNQLGIRNNAGLKKELDQSLDEIENQINLLLSAVHQSRQVYLTQLRIYYLVFFVVLLLLILAASLYLSAKITLPLIKLTSNISNFVSSGFTMHKKIEISGGHDEIAILYDEFNNMVDQLGAREEERNKARYELQENELKFRNLADILPLSFYETDELGNFTYVNKTWYETFGYKEADVKEGLNIIETIISDDRDNIIRGSRFESNEYIALNRDGSTFSVLVYSDPLYTNNKCKGYRGFIIDNNERKQYVETLKLEKEKAERSDRLKSSFLANMSHEIRTPMNAILGFSDLLTQPGMSEVEKKDFIDCIKKSGELLLRLIDDIIDVAKIEAGELKINRISCQVNKMFSDLFNTYLEELRRQDKKHLELKFLKGNSDDNFSIVSDPIRLRQILTNLIVNAIKFTETGAIEFSYLLFAIPPSHYRGKKLPKAPVIIFAVEDTGIGIPKDKLRVIFERFRQADDSTTRLYGGTGLGLTISRSLVELLGGEIWVTSNVGKGTSFYFYLPLVKTHPEPPKLPLPIISYENINWINKVILIAEDNETNFLFLKEILRKTKVNILWAKNGKEAVKIIKTNPNIDLVLMDIQMPGLNGYDATRQIKAVRQSIPVIAQTAYAMEGEKEKTDEAGCDEYIAKPIKKELIYATMSKYLDNPAFSDEQYN